MTGIYVHIPFCKSRCIYCGFYSTTDTGLKQRYVDALVAEAQSRSAEGEIATIYLGGGTPSQLSIFQMRQIFDALYSSYDVADNAEVTVECNPDDITESFAEGISQLPANRISMGVQTFSPERLRFLHRRHTASQVHLAIQRLRQAGICNISIDLMYGFPGETLAEWEDDISEAVKQNVQHISAYCLTYEENTPLQHMLEQGLVSETDEELLRMMYYTLDQRLAESGYEHYEISNYARPGYRSRHNNSYWTDIPYIGLGAAAHSYDGTYRQWNPDDIHRYITGIEQSTSCAEREFIDNDTRYNDRVMLALRTKEGINISELSPKYRDYLTAAAGKFIDKGLLNLTDGHISLNREALFISDMIISELMKV